MFVNVPATIMTSDCRGLGLKMMPNLSKSYLAAPTCIISTAQQARPKVIGHIDPVRAQFTKLSTFDTTNLQVNQLYEALWEIQSLKSLEEKLLSCPNRVLTTFDTWKECERFQ